MNRNSGRRSSDDLELYTSVDDDAFAELDQLARQQVMHVHIWDDTVAGSIEDDWIASEDGAQVDTPASEVENEAFYEYDVDVYLEEGIFFELYSVLVYSDPDAEPYSDAAALRTRLADVIERGLWLEEVAADEDEELVLIFNDNQSTVLYLVVGAWTLDEWTELPDDSDTT